MKNIVLMNTEEPTDNQLIGLMHEVAMEANKKALISKQQLAEKIKKLIEKINE